MDLVKVAHPVTIESTGQVRSTCHRGALSHAAPPSPSTNGGQLRISSLLKRLSI
ncbi:hypothetical protein BVRB_042930 [Beta vulgaris subsp. vulgaris]|uniref:Uncharacterized protein n=1 Tax=Beta vulgaris subsp. vulgaris TaxID=3555 RepID=A0A0J7YMC0_BETVV|nr:hypothetical protein BVRB_042930 [Beta vulgaris subsp. vulgaris]